MSPLGYNNLRNLRVRNQHWTPGGGVESHLTSPMLNGINKVSKKTKQQQQKQQQQRPISLWQCKPNNSKYPPILPKTQ